MNKDVKYDLYLIDLLDFFYLIYSDILINRDKYKNVKGLKPVICFNIILKFLRDLDSKYSNKNAKYFFYIKEPDIKSLDLKKIKDSISKREKNIDHHFYYFFNILLEILKNYRDTYFLYYNNTSLTDKIIELNKNKSVLIISRKMDKCKYLSVSDSIYWYNHHLTYDYKSFTSTFKFLPLEGKLKLYAILTRKPSYRTKFYKNYNITNDMSVLLTNKFDSFEDMRSTFPSRVSDDIKKKLYNWMKIFLINKQSIKNDEYSVFDLDEGHIFQSKNNPSLLNIWRKILKIEI